MIQDFLYLCKAELIITFLLVLLLIMKLSMKEEGDNRWLGFFNILLALNFLAGLFFVPTGNIFGDMFRSNSLIAMEKNMLNLGALLVSLQSWHWLKNNRNAIEFYLLLLSTLLGMFFMLSSRNLLMFYLALELSTIPLAALSNFDLEKRKSSEAAFKFIISSAFSSGLLLFGISLIYGATGSLNFEFIAAALKPEPLMIFGFILLLAGFAFKISAVPFHLWTADVYEGSPVPVTSYLSVISKGAVLFVMLSVLYEVFAALSEAWSGMIFILAVATMIVGNLFALRQANVKRFLAFSSIAQVGFILVGLRSGDIPGTASVIFFVLVYIFSNLGAFGVVSLVTAFTGREDMGYYKGFYKSNPGLTWVLAIAIFSLAGIPPMAGFFGKYFLLFAGAAQGDYALLIIAALNIVVSLYYYLNFIRMLFMDEAPEPVGKIRAGWAPGLAMLICTVGILACGIYGGVYEYILQHLK
jgi:NADH-quinone oxidoreductase subunit N